MPTIEDLWGGRLLSVAFDPCSWRATLIVVVDSGGERTEYRLVFDGVADLRLARGTELPWEYAELTEIRLRRRADGSTLVEVVLWEDRSSLTATCSGVDLGFTPATADA